MMYFIVSRTTRILLVTLTVLAPLLVLVTGCHGLPKEPPITLIPEETLVDIARCSGGISLGNVTRSGLGLELEKEKKTYSGVLSSEYKGYVSNTVLSDSNIQEAVKVKFLDKYFPCINKRLEEKYKKEQSELDSILQRAQRQWNAWAEAEKNDFKLDPNLSVSYEATANDLMKLATNTKNLKSKIRIYDRAALMYMLASELLIRSSADRASNKTRETTYNQKALTAAKKTETSFDSIMGNLTATLSDWIEQSDVRNKTFNRLADIYAQSIYLGREEHTKDLEAALAKLGCSYIKKYKIFDEAIYSRIKLPALSQSCNQHVAIDSNVRFASNINPKEIVTMPQDKDSTTIPENVNTNESVDIRPPIDMPMDPENKIRPPVDKPLDIKSIHPPVDGIHKE